MIIDCNSCQSKVDGKSVFHRRFSPNGELPFEYHTLTCPSCQEMMVGCRESFGHDGDQEVWSDLMRVWPNPAWVIGPEVPEDIRHSLLEAEKCFRASAFDACAVMCGRVIECICRHYQTKGRYLAGGLQELLQRQIIDHRIFAWSEALREHRNIGAHAGDEKVAPTDAKDLLEFTRAICEYVFVLSKKFETFLERKAKRTDTLKNAEAKKS